MSFILKIILFLFLSFHSLMAYQTQSNDALIFNEIEALLVEDFREFETSYEKKLSIEKSQSNHRMRARWMDNSSGRFLGVDPYAGDPMSPASLHRYMYANNSPISFSDPSGNMTLATVFVGSALAIGYSHAISAVFSIYNLMKTKVGGRTNKFKMRTWFSIGSSTSSFVSGSFSVIRIEEDLPANENPKWGQFWVFGVGAGLGSGSFGDIFESPFTTGEFETKNSPNRSILDFDGLGHVISGGLGYSIPGKGKGNPGLNINWSYFFMAEGTQIQPSWAPSVTFGVNSRKGINSGISSQLLYWDMIDSNLGD